MIVLRRLIRRAWLHRGSTCWTFPMDLLDGADARTKGRKLVVHVSTNKSSNQQQYKRWTLLNTKAWSWHCFYYQPFKHCHFCFSLFVIFNLLVLQLHACSWLNDGCNCCNWWRLENAPCERLQLAWTTGSPLEGKVAGGGLAFLLRHLLNIQYWFIINACFACSWSQVMEKAPSCTAAAVALVLEVVLGGAIFPRRGHLLSIQSWFIVDTWSTCSIRLENSRRPFNGCGCCCGVGWSDLPSWASP